MRHDAFPSGLSRDALLTWYRGIRARTRALFDLVLPEAYYHRPITLRNPIVFYEGHLPGFSVNTLVKRGLRRDGVDDRLETLFARGIDPEDESTVRNPTDIWPAREEVQAFADACDRLVEEALQNAPLEDDSVPHLRRGEAVLTILEHELMHQETLLYMLHELPYAMKVGGRQPGNLQGFSPAGGTGSLRVGAPVRIPQGEATLGKPCEASYGWDNEFPQQVLMIPEFSIEPFNVTNGVYLEYMKATGAPAPHFWECAGDAWFRRGMFELRPLPLDAPVYVTHDEAVAFARWKGKRLPTEAEYHRAAYGTPSGEERSHPWGDAAPDATLGNFDLAHWDPVAVGSYPAGVSAWGIHDLVGNGWEWTSSPFAGFPGFAPMPTYPEYSADFFDDAHFVLKGASPVTPKELVRRTFRNWFRPSYPYVFATFRCVG